VADRALYWQVLCDAPVRAITLGWGARKLHSKALEDMVRELKDRLQHKPVRGVHLGAAPLPLQEPLFSLAPGVAVTLRDGCVKVTGGTTGLLLEAAPHSLPLLGHFATPQTLASALLAPGLEEPQAMLQAAATARELIDLGVLAPAPPRSQTRR
jgi:hypothetical protein